MQFYVFFPNALNLKKIFRYSMIIIFNLFNIIQMISFLLIVLFSSDKHASLYK